MNTNIKQFLYYISLKTFGPVYRGRQYVSKFERIITVSGSENSITTVGKSEMRSNTRKKKHLEERENKLLQIHIVSNPNW
jgi:hypothetical protein